MQCNISVVDVELLVSVLTRGGGRQLVSSLVFVVGAILVVEEDGGLCPNRP